MLTPKFEIEQDSEFLIIHIQAPYIKVSSVETYIDGDLFQFHCHPYFLSLRLPAPLTENGKERACYDVDTGDFVVYAPKLNSGQHFPDLDMITKLLTQPKKQSNIEAIIRGPEISILDEDIPDSQHLTAEGDEAPGHDEVDELDWILEQVPPDTTPLFVTGGPSYGFANQRQGVFSRLQEELPELVSLPDPDKVPPSERAVLRTACEILEFDPEHYLADTMDTAHLESVFSHRAYWDQAPPTSKVMKLTEKERVLLTQLPKKEYLLETSTEYQLFYGLIDILFAYCYASRSTCGEMNVESAWSVWKLSSTFSWLDIFSSIRDTLLACLRRSLCYPLHRNFELSLAALGDTCAAFSSGKLVILKCLLDSYRLFAESDLYYVHNDLYLKDYCVWIQSVGDKKVAQVAKQMRECGFKKEELGLELLEFEVAALIALEEERRGEEIIPLVQGMSEKLVLSDSESEETLESNDKF